MVSALMEGTLQYLPHLYKAGDVFTQENLIEYMQEEISTINYINVCLFWISLEMGMKI